MNEFFFRNEVSLHTLKRERYVLQEEQRLATETFLAKRVDAQ